MSSDAYLIGYDIGSSSVKATIINAQNGQLVASATSPADTELEIIATQTGWAEQHPNMWWNHVIDATNQLKASASIDLHDISAIGISYQMHGLVMVDKDLSPIANSIIWCDSRAVSVGEKAFSALGEETCLSHLLNPPGNFTASKLRWVIENQPDVAKKTFKFMLPGDFIALKLTGEVTTTASGLSEGMLWDYTTQKPADMLLDHYQIGKELLAPLVPTFGIQGSLTESAAAALGLKKGTPVSYRAGDQPNNALSLNVLKPGEIAATAGTSGVVYGVTDKMSYDKEGRVNTFLHVNSTETDPRLGILLCVNGTGILNRWLKNVIGDWSPDPISYKAMDIEAEHAPAGCDGLSLLPFGNGAERTLGNKSIGASIHGLDLSRHSRAHLLRAAQEGIVFALKYGIDIMHTLGVNNGVVRAGDANMFKSPLFTSVFATTVNAPVELYNTDGAQGAARGAGVGACVYTSLKDAFSNLSVIKRVEPDTSTAAAYNDAYGRWLETVKSKLNS